MFYTKRIIMKNIYILTFLLATLLSIFGCQNDKDKQTSSKITGDPMVKITSLPIKQEISKILPLISKAVSEETGLDKKFITYYWQYFENIYCPGLEANDLECPLFIDLYTPALT